MTVCKISLDLLGCGYQFKNQVYILITGSTELYSLVLFPLSFDFRPCPTAWRTQSSGPELTGMEISADIPYLCVSTQDPANVWQQKRFLHSPAPDPLVETCQEKMPVDLVLF